MLVSLCAGQGHDVIGVLPDHPRRGDVRAVLVESDARNVVLARRAAAGQDLPGVEIRQADAGLVAGFADVLPADVLLLCGIFGNVSDHDAPPSPPLPHTTRELPGNVGPHRYRLHQDNNTTPRIDPKRCSMQPEVSPWATGPTP